MNVYEVIAFALYFILVLGIGIYFFVKSKDKVEITEEEFGGDEDGLY